MNTLRLGSGRQYRSAALVEMLLPLAYDAALLRGARILGEDGQIYESMRDPVSGEYEWKVRAQGERGPALELQKSETHIQWRVEGNTGPWFDLVPLEDLIGPTGDQGDQGPSGPGFAFQGSVATVADLPTPSTQGYAYLVASTGDLHIYSGTAWINSGPIQGPPGEQGDPGSEIELQKTATEIQWRLVDEPTWITLVLLDDLKGEAGKSVELRKTSTEIQWRLVGEPTWITLVALDDIKGPVGDTGDTGPAGPGFSYQGTVATVAALPIPSTQGFGFKVIATGDLYIYSGTAWVNAGPLQGPKGDPGIQGDQGNPGPGFSYQGSLANTSQLPNPSTQGHAYRIGTDLWIYNGIAWVNAGSLQGPKGDQGDMGLQGNPGTAATIQLGTIATGAAGSSVSITNVGTPNAAVLNITIPRGDTGAVGSPGSPGVVTATAPLTYNSSTQTLAINSASASSAGSMSSTDKAKLDAMQSELGTSSTPQFAGLGLGTAPVAGWELTVRGGTCQQRLSLPALSGIYTLDVQAANEFITAAAINGAITVNLSNLANIPSGYVWRGVLNFSYTSGTITWFSGNTGYTVKWDGGSAMTPTASQVETVVISVVGGGNTIEIASLKGRD